jgi:hypothetical protein
VRNIPGTEFLCSERVVKYRFLGEVLELSCEPNADPEASLSKPTLKEDGIWW